MLEKRERLEQKRKIARGNLEARQVQQKQNYDCHAQDREFKVGDQVLVVLSDNNNKFLSRWQGPFQVVRRVGLVHYEVERTG